MARLFAVHKRAKWLILLPKYGMVVKFQETTPGQVDLLEKKE